LLSDEPVLKGVRVALRTVLASLADGDSPGKILAAFSTLKPKYIQAAIAFAAASAEEDLPVLVGFHSVIAKKRTSAAEAGIKRRPLRHG